MVKVLECASEVLSVHPTHWLISTGADDIFVYWDTWTASKTVPYKTEAHRLKHAWSHAAGAMAVTSMTTILSFLSNLASPFIGVVTFGVFAALLVFVNYCAVTTFFPSLVLVYDSHVTHTGMSVLSCVEINQCVGCTR